MRALLADLWPTEAASSAMARGAAAARDPQTVSSESNVVKDAATSKEPVGVTAALLAIMIAAFWGANPVAVSFSMDVVPPIAVAAIRFLLATGVMYFWCRWLEKTTISLQPHQYRPVLITGLLLFLQITTFNLGVWLTNSSHSSLLINTFVFWVVILEHFVTHTDRLTLRKIAGLVFAGGSTVVVLLTAQSESPADVVDAGRQVAMDEPTLAGDLIMAGSALILAVKILYTKRALRHIESGRLIFWHNVVGVVLFILTSLLFERWDPGMITPVVVAALLYQGLLVAGLCFGIQAFLLRKHSASQISVFSFATPLFGITVAVLLRGDRLSPWLLLAGIFVAAGIVLVQIPSED